MNNENIKKIGLWNIVGLGVGGAVGSGIFVTLGSAIEKTGRSILPITIICVFYMLLAYWYNLGMSGIFVINGGDYSMKGMLLPPLLTGYGGWTNVIWAFGFTGYALALTSYLGNLFPVVNDHSKLISAMVLTLFFLLSIRGNRIVTLFQNVATGLLVVALILFVIMGIPSVNTANFFNATFDGGFFHGGFGGMISAIAIMGWACQGTTMGPVGVVPITKNPKRTIPMGILVTCVVVSVVYGLMSYVASGVLPYEQIAGENLSVTAQAIMPHGLFAFFVIGGGICAIISSFLAVLAMIREPLSHMADDGWFPSAFRKKSSDGYPGHERRQCHQHADDPDDADQLLSECRLHDNPEEVSRAVREALNQDPGVAVQCLQRSRRILRRCCGHHAVQGSHREGCNRCCSRHHHSADLLRHRTEDRFCEQRGT